MKDMTKENLSAALAGESQAHITYTAFAAQAEKEGKPNIARLFTAIASAEKTHATRHLKALGKVGGTVANLEAAIAGETFEVNEMYAAYLVVAESQDEKAARETMSDAREAEKGHAALYTVAKEAAAAGKDIVADKIYVCLVCGFTHIGEPPDRCPICSTKKERFQVY